MRSLLGLMLTLALLLTGCGDDEPDAAPDTGSSESTAAGDEPDATSAKPVLLTLITQSDIGGKVEPVARPLDSDEAIADFAAEFSSDAVVEALTTVVGRQEVPKGQVPAGAVVAIGCEAPPTAKVEVTDEGVEVTAKPVKSDQQCLVATTTIAIVAADPDQL